MMIITVNDEKMCRCSPERASVSKEHQSEHERITKDGLYYQKPNTDLKRHQEISEDDSRRRRSHQSLDSLEERIPWPNWTVLPCLGRVLLGWNHLNGRAFSREDIHRPIIHRPLLVIHVVSIAMRSVYHRQSMKISCEMKSRADARSSPEMFS
jgi:hypothetical protein